MIISEKNRKTAFKLCKFLFIFSMISAIVMPVFLILTEYMGAKYGYQYSVIRENYAAFIISVIHMVLVVLFYAKGTFVRS